MKPLFTVLYFSSYIYLYPLTFCVHSCSDTADNFCPADNFGSSLCIVYVKVAILDPSLVLCLWSPALDPPMGTSGMLWPPVLDPPLGMQGVVICGWRLAHVALCDV